MALDVNKAQQVYRRSLQVLRESQLKNGGTLASKNRYQFVYPRDHAAVLLAFLEAGDFTRVKKGLEFVFSNQLKNGAFPQRYDPAGKDASYKPIQLDSVGSTLFVTAKYLQKTNDQAFAKKIATKMAKAVRYVESQFSQKNPNLLHTANSIFEAPPIEEGLEIWSNSSCGGALKELSKTKLVGKKLGERCRTLAKRIEKGILKNMWMPHKGKFIKTIRTGKSSSVYARTNASSYGVAEFGILPENDPRIKTTVRQINKEIWDGKTGGIYPYAKRDGTHNSGRGGWSHYTLMIARHYINTGQKRMADKYLNWAIKNSYRGQLPEHVTTWPRMKEYIRTFGRAGIIRPDRKRMFRKAYSHPASTKEKIFVETPLSWAHAEYVRTWKLYKQKFRVKVQHKKQTKPRRRRK